VTALLAGVGAAVPGAQQATQAVTTLGQALGTLQTATAASSAGMLALVGTFATVATAAVGVAGATFALTKQFTDNRLALRDMHLETGMTLPQLQALTDQARRGNIEFENLGTMLIRFNANIAQAQRDPNSQPGQMLFGSLRMTRQDLQDPFTALLSVAQRIQQLDPSNQGLVIRALFGRNPAEVFRLFNQLTGENLTVLRQRLQELQSQGPGAFEAVTDKAQQFQNRVAELETQVRTRWRAIIETFGLPIANTLLDWIDSAAQKGQALLGVLEKIGRYLPLQVPGFVGGNIGGWNIVGATTSPSGVPVGPPPPPTTFQPTIEAAARYYGIDPTLVARLIQGESRFDPFAVSPRGARGLMQIMPREAERRGVAPDELFQAERNIWLGTQILAENYQRFAGQPDAWQLAVAGFNAGPATVQNLRQLAQRGGIAQPGYAAIAPELPAETRRLVGVVFPPQGAGSPYGEATQATTAHTAAVEANTRATAANAEASGQVRTPEQVTQLEKERDLYKSEAEALELLVIQRRADILARKEDTIAAEQFQRQATQALRERQLYEQQRQGEPGRLPLDVAEQVAIYRRRVQQLGAQALGLGAEQQALQAHEAVVQARLRVDAREQEEEQRAREAVVAARVRAEAAEEKAATDAAEAVVRARVRSEAAEDSYLQKLHDTTEELATQQAAIEALRAHPGADVQVLRLRRGLAGVTDLDKRTEAEGQLTTIEAQNQAIRRAQEMVQLSRRVGTEIEQVFSDVWTNVFDLAEGKGQDFGKNLVQSLQRFFRQFMLDLVNTQLNALTGTSGQTGGWSGQLGATLLRLFPGGSPQPAARGGLFTSPTLALVGEAGPELVLPVRAMQDGGLVEEDVATEAEASAAVESLRQRGVYEAALAGASRRQALRGLGGAAGAGAGGALGALLLAPPDLQKAQAIYAERFRAWTDQATGDVYVGSVDASKNITWASKVPGAVGYVAEPQEEGAGRQAGRALLSLVGSLAGAYAGSRLRRAQQGAVLRGPTMLLAGEAGAEAIIPLRHGGIPVSLDAAGRPVSRLPSGVTIPLLPMPRLADGGVIGSSALPATWSSTAMSPAPWSSTPPALHLTMNVNGVQDTQGFRATQSQIMRGAALAFQREWTRNL